MQKQIEITQPGNLLDNKGKLTKVGWSRQPLLHTNLEKANFYWFKPLQFLRVKRWDYYAIFSPERFFSATVADLGYAGNVFAYTVDFLNKTLHEVTLVLPLSKGIEIPNDSTSGSTTYQSDTVNMSFNVMDGNHRLLVDWPGFDGEKALKMDVTLKEKPDHESMVIVIPIGEKRFYYNRKTNCMPAEGVVHYGEETIHLSADKCLGSLDWGRGVWEYSSFWNWASASGFLKDGRSIGLNIGEGFGDTSNATEDCFVLDGNIHKLGKVPYNYSSGDYMKDWIFRDEEGRIDLTFTPFLDRPAETHLLVIDSVVHQMFGHYNGTLMTEDGEKVIVENLIGFAEEHKARW